MAGMRSTASCFVDLNAISLRLHITHDLLDDTLVAEAQGTTGREDQQLLARATRKLNDVRDEMLFPFSNAFTTRSQNTVVV